jgi:hypothetical protein
MTAMTRTAGALAGGLVGGATLAGLTIGSFTTEHRREDSPGALTNQKVFGAARWPLGIATPVVLASAASVGWAGHQEYNAHITEAQRALSKGVAIGTAGVLVGAFSVWMAKQTIHDLKASN